VRIKVFTIPQTCVPDTYRRPALARRAPLLAEDGQMRHIH
jgi:hypothetical protein